MQDFLINPGTLYGIGVGPGDPELLTVKGLQRLQRAEVVAFPAGQGGRSGLAQQIVAPWLQPQQRQLPLVFPYVQDATQLHQAWQQAAHQVWHYLIQGLDVAFVCEGDVSFYSTFGYLSQTLRALQPEVAIETIPGVCSPLAAAAVRGEPLVWREQRLVILPALYQVAELETALAWAEVVVLLKLSSVYEMVWQVLQARGLLEHSYVVERCSWPEQKVYVDLRPYPQLQLSYFSLLVVQVAGLANFETLAVQLGVFD